MTYRLVHEDSELLYTRDWTPYLPEAASINGHLWTIEPAITLAGENGPTVTVSGFVKGTVYRLTDTVTIDNGETDAYSITIRCDDR